MRKIELFKRYLLFIIGLFVNSVGICLIIKADLGSSPISSIPYTFSFKVPISLGWLTFILNIFLIIGQIILLKKDFKPREWLQLPVSVLFSLFIDSSMYMLQWVEPDMYIYKIAVLVIGCIILGLGVSLEVIADVVMLSGEAFVHACSKKTGKEFGVIKIIFDSSLMILACIISLIFFNAIVGVREGTIVAAILVGFVARIFNKRLNFLKKYLVTKEDTKIQLSEVVEKENFVVTIAREYGSGGHQIGELVAKRLGIPFYDKELIDNVAKENNMEISFVKNADQNIRSTLLYDLVMQDFSVPIEESLSKDDAVFVAQSRMIRKLASKSSCVIVGRCANYILKDYKKCIRVFIHADYATKYQRVTREYGIEETTAKSMLSSVDRGRANHYKTYTGEDWWSLRNYDLCIDSGKFGVSESVDIIVNAMKNVDVSECDR